LATYKEYLMHELAVMDRTGDTKTVWDPGNEAEVDNAKKQFDDLRKKGFAIYSVDKAGDKNTVIHKFDPNAAKMIAVPPVVGG
jgi:hypothetical protein